jgi:polyisoprenoid-binding protein YceI
MTSMRMTCTAQSKLWLTGNSTLHPFKIDVAEWQARFDHPAVSFEHLPANGQTQQSLTTQIEQHAIKNLQLIMAAPSLHGEDPEFQKNLHELLKASQYPYIQFHLTQYDVLPSPPENPVFFLHVRGKLSIITITRDVTCMLQFHRSLARIQGSLILKLSDFNIVPPSAMGGLVKIDDVLHAYIELYLEWTTLNQKTSSPGSRA